MKHEYKVNFIVCCTLRYLHDKHLRLKLSSTYIYSLGEEANGKGDIEIRRRRLTLFPNPEPVFNNIQSRKQTAVYCKSLSRIKVRKVFKVLHSYFLSQ